MTQAKGLGAAVAFKGQEVELAAVGHSAVLAHAHKVSVRGVGHCVCKAFESACVGVRFAGKQVVMTALLLSLHGRLSLRLGRAT